MSLSRDSTAAITVITIIIVIIIINNKWSKNFDEKPHHRGPQNAPSIDQSIVYFSSGPSNKITSGSTGGGE